MALPEASRAAQSLEPKVAHGLFCSSRMRGTAAAPNFTVPPVLPTCNAPVLLLEWPGLVGMAATVSERPGGTFHCCNAPGAMNTVLLKTKSAVAAVISMPRAPLVSVLPELICTVAPGSAMTMPAADRLPPRLLVVFAAVTVLSQRTMSVLVGTALFTHAAGVLSAEVLSALTKVSACATETAANAARETKRRRM